MTTRSRRRNVVRTVTLLIGGSIVLATGVAMLLLAALGSDGYSTLVNGIRLATGIPFVLANIGVGVFFLALAWLRKLPPGPGTLVQMICIGSTVSVWLALIEEPDALWLRILLLAAALPVLSLGIALYLGSQTGAGPPEAAALSFDPPIPFRWSYTVLLVLGAGIGWALGAAIGPGTVVTFTLGPLIDLAARLLRLDTSQHRSAEVRPDSSDHAPDPDPAL